MGQKTPKNYGCQSTRIPDPGEKGDPESVPDAAGFTLIYLIKQQEARN